MKQNNKTSFQSFSKVLRGEKAFEVIKLFAAIFVALGITFAVLCVSSSTPIDSFVTLLTAPLTKLRYFGYVFETMVPLAFAGLATSLLFRTGLFNLGTEGVYYISGVVTAIVSNHVLGNYILDPIITITISGIVGGLIAMIPGYFKAKYNANELVTSLMMNSILFGVGLFIIKTFIKATDVPSIASEKFMITAKLPVIIPGTRVHLGIIILIVVTILVYILLFKTKLGYAIRMTGLNKDFAKYSGMSAFALFLSVHFISGFIAGMGSSIELLGMYERFTWTVLPGLGFTGALMAMLGKNNPIGVFIAAFGISYLRAGAEIMSRSSDVPVELVAIVEAILVLLISSQYFLRKWRERVLLKEGTAHE